MDFCQKIVTYSRTHMIGNEAQCLALVLAMLTAYAPSVKEYVSVGILGELASGKTLCVNVVLGEYLEGVLIEGGLVGLLPQSHIYRVTSASPKALIYSDALKEPEFGTSDSPIRIIFAAEYQKLEEATIEYLKSQSGDDPMFVYEFTDVVSRNQGGSSTKRIKQKKRVFVFTYAQSELDNELGSRIVRFAVDENKKINKCVNNKKHGCPAVEYKGYTYTLEGDPALEAEIRDQVELLAGYKPIKVENPFYMALSDLEDCSRASSKRTSGMIEAYFKSSARANFIDRDINEEGSVIVASQDLVNVLCLNDILQSMVLEIDVIDMAIVRLLGVARKSVDAKRIITQVSSSGLPELTQAEFSGRIDRLIDLNYVTVWNGDDESGNKLKKDWYKLNRDKYIHPLTVHWELAYDIDPGPVTNPLTGDRYLDIREFGKDFDKLIREGIETNASLADPEYVPTFDETVFSSIQRLISHGKQYKFGDTAKMQSDCMADLGQTGLLDFEKFNASINGLMQTGMIEVDPVTKMYVVPDPSTKANRVRNRVARTDSIIEG